MGTVKKEKVMEMFDKKQLDKRYKLWEQHIKDKYPLTFFEMLLLGALGYLETNLDDIDSSLMEIANNVGTLSDILETGVVVRK